ncbi:MAG: STAS domain-containing protein [Xanthobacteraceae bacterium]
MNITVEDIPGGIAKIRLSGRFDTTGAVMVELPFNKTVTEKQKVLVDLSEVNFLASYGIRVLLVGAKLARAKQGKLVVVCPDNNVAKVLKIAGTDSLIPMFHSQADAAAALAVP